ncbi:acetyltransferase [Amylocarpus encephaloides]|uniref:Acetyltransferase n=1 Tax=Amylocarpus encephaloides TaxID=45428 RepID=A0A9P7Y9T2_9HELO|nr:acetyltransferase [Amylocarpus encephaloides]
MDPPTLFDPILHAHLIPSIAAVHAACITTEPYAIATFLPPLNTALMTSWWEDRSKEVTTGTRWIILQLAHSHTSGEEAVAGIVMLSAPYMQTAPFRGGVEKLLVAPSWRKRGIAKAMMGMLEEVARREGKELLLLDTEAGSPAELVYPRLGYIEIGVIPNYDISPKDGLPRGGRFFYKDLRQKN